MREKVTDLWLVFDVESIGLHGTGFAYGGRVIRGPVALEESCAWCEPTHLDGGSIGNREWIEIHVMPHLRKDRTQLLENPREVRERFWHWWRKWEELGARLVTDCGWPVEANFLSACVAEHMPERELEGPYPLLDIAPLIVALGGDPVAVTDRLPIEVPAHHPLCDARQTARQWVKALGQIRRGALSLKKNLIF